LIITNKKDYTLRLYPLFSSSSGNCYYLGSKTEGFLIDAGSSAKRITAALAANDIPLTAVKGIFVTHEHTDHVSALRVLLKRINVPVIGTRGTIAMISNALSGADLHSFSDRLEISGALCTGEVKIIKTSHDSAEPCGFRFDFDDSVISFITDSGVITDDFGKAFGSGTAVLESNYDPVMLRYGTYDARTKARVAGSQGHLSNKQSGEFAALLLKTGTKNIILAHISEHNNTPETASEAFLAATSGYKNGRDYFLKTLPAVCEPWFITI
jgi:phosphoribosyl 1,2-cyclic phosphodiesterase